MTFDFNIAILIPVLISALLSYALYRINKAQDARDERLARAEQKIAEIQLSAAQTYATNSTVDKLDAKLDAALAILHRLEGRQEATGG